jgi:hypothetical protein
MFVYMYDRESICSLSALQVLLSDARVLGLGPRFMSIYIHKLAVSISTYILSTVLTRLHNGLLFSTTRAFSLKDVYIMMKLKASQWNGLKLHRHWC